MQQELLLNVIPFTAPIQEKHFAFYTDKREGYYPIHIDNLKDLIGKNIKEKLEFHKWLYTDFQTAKEGAIVIKINLIKNPDFANHYYRYLIRNYFKNVADITRKNFTNEIEVWFHNQNESTVKYKVYDHFTLKVQHAKITQGPELVISFDGKTKIYNKSIAELKNFKTELYNWINCDGELHRWKYLSDKQKLNHEKNYPVIGKALKGYLKIPTSVLKVKNPYPRYYELLTDFYNKYLNTEIFKTIIPLAKHGFYNPEDLLVQRISGTSNELEFGNGTGIEPKKDLRRLKPYKPVPKPNNIKFFFIYHTPDKRHAVKTIWEYFLNGFKGEPPFPRMEEFISQPFELEKGESISFDNIDEAVETVNQKIKDRTPLPDTKYFAIYISPVSKSDESLKRKNIYYRIKEILLYKDIASQVIWKENIVKPNFGFSLPNIQIAILAKLGGIPWRLKRNTNNELIIGVGAFYSSTQKTKYVGSAFCFNNEGIFKDFNCFSADDTDNLAGSIRDAVNTFIESNYKATRLIIHFYKKISQKELKPIIDTLYALGLSIPVIVITINKTESKELIAFDISNEKLMPYSGTIIKVGPKEYLLFNNTRYNENSTPTDKEYHFPIKLSFFSSDAELLEDSTLTTELIDQIYQFSKMYWKSVSQQNLPVTIKYPEMVAEIYPHFQYDRLSEFAKNSLWFL